MKKIVIICGLMIFMISITQAQNTDSKTKVTTDSTYWFVSWIRMDPINLLYAVNGVFVTPTDWIKADVIQKVSHENNSSIYVIAVLPINKVTYEDFVMKHMNHASDTTETPSFEFEVEYALVDMSGLITGQGVCSSIIATQDWLPIPYVEMLLDKKDPKHTHVITRFTRK